MSRHSRLWTWWREAPLGAKRALLAAALGWMLDAFDVMIYALVVAYLMQDLHLGKTGAGLLGSLTLAASALGGLIFGRIADRYGRTKALMGSIIIYSLFTAACGLARTVVQLAIFRLFLGLGMGGEWASGAALVSETWPAQHRGKALGVMQSFWAVGYGAAAVVMALVLPWLGWRAVFFVGILPAFFTLWVRRRVPEPEIWRQQQHSQEKRVGLQLLFQRGWLRLTVPITLMNALTMFSWWGFNLWVPAYLTLPGSQGGFALSNRVMALLVLVMQVGMFFGYLSFGFLADRFGRKRVYVSYLLCAAVLVTAYALVRQPVLLLFLGPVLAFFGTGYFSGFGALTAEVYPTVVRATAQGFTYNIGRIFSAVAPFAVGSLAQKQGFTFAFLLTAGSFLLAALMWRWIPETSGRELS